MSPNTHKKNNNNSCHASRSLTKWTTITALTLFTMLVAALPLSSVAFAATKIDTTQFKLEIIPIALKLPADGGTYYAMIQLQTLRDSKPIAAPFDLDITVLSSDPSVLIGQEKVTLNKGESMVKAELKSTNKPGEVSISAQAEGIKSGNVNVNTLILDSLEATKLTISGAISTAKGTAVAVPDPKVPETLYIQLLNSRDLPAISNKPVVVSLSSSRPQFGTVPSYATIPAGQSGVSVDFSPNTEVGTTTIAASSPGLSPSRLDLKTDGPVATKLAVDFGPSIIATGTGYGSSTMTVQLQDEDGNPVKSTRSVLVTLKSSDESVAEVPKSVEILPGHSYASAPIRAKGGVGCVDPDILSDGFGCAIITASATDFQSGISTLKVTQPADENVQYSIYLYSVPAKLPPDNSEHASIIMQFVDDDRGQDTQHPRPYLPASNTLFNGVSLSTSDAKLGSINSNYVLMPGYAIAKFTTTYFTGTTTITGSRTGYAPAEMDLEVIGSAPAAIKLTQIPTIVEANNLESDLLSVSLADSSGKPVIAPEEVAISLSSSNPTIATVSPTVVIPAGKAYVIEKVSVTDKVGQSTISASAVALASADLAFETKGSKGTNSQYAIGLYTIPNLSADDREYEAVIIQLQDLAGNPVRAKDDIKVTLSSSSMVAGKVQPEIIIPSGSSYMVAKFDTTSAPDASIKITASSAGFKSVEATMQTTVQPLTVKITSTTPRQQSFGDEVPIEVEVKSGSIPVEGATIEFGGPQSKPTSAVTNEDGIASGNYVPRLPGTNIIEVKATKPGYKETIAKTSVTIAQTINLNVMATSEGGTLISAQLKVQPPTGAVKEYNVSPTSPAKFTKAKWGTYRITAPTEFTNSMGKFTFLHWSDGLPQNPRSFEVVSDQTIKAVYAASFLLTVTSDYGQTSGTGYYKEGTMVPISIDTTSVNGLISKNFAGWTGDIQTQSANAQVEMNGPKVIKAQWQDSYLIVGILAAAIGGGGLVAYLKIIKPRKQKAEKSNAPDLDWYKK